jgi:hypothetical protein
MNLDIIPHVLACLAACDSEGKALFDASDGDDLSYTCPLGNPDPGVYNLWITYYKPGYCRMC